MLVAVSSKDDLAILTGPFGQDAASTYHRTPLSAAPARPKRNGG
jgi:hypothetical protein